MNGKRKYFCPFHDDAKTPNLFVDEKGFKCFACYEKGDIFRFHQKKSCISFPMVLEDLAKKYAPQLLDSNGSGKTPKNIVETYPYKDEEGNLLFESVRYEPKSFAYRKLNKNGDWVWNLKGVSSQRTSVQ